MTKLVKIRPPKPRWSGKPQCVPPAGLPPGPPESTPRGIASKTKWKRPRKVIA